MIEQMNADVRIGTIGGEQWGRFGSAYDIVMMLHRFTHTCAEREKERRRGRGRGKTGETVNLVVADIGKNF